MAEEMTARERVLTALLLGTPDRVPWVEGIVDRTGPAMDLAGWAREEDFLGELLRYAREMKEDSCLAELSQKELSLLYGDARVRRFLEIPDPQRLRELLEKAEAFCAEGLKGGENP